MYEVDCLVFWRPKGGGALALAVVRGEAKPYLLLGGQEKVMEEEKYKRAASDD